MVQTGYIYIHLRVSLQCPLRAALTFYPVMMTFITDFVPLLRRRRRFSYVFSFCCRRLRCVSGRKKFYQKRKEKKKF